MQRKWIAVIVFWTVFLVCFNVGQLSFERGHAIDVWLVCIVDGTVLLLSIAVIARCFVGGSTTPFWKTRGYPEWFLRFAADKDKREAQSAGRPIDPVL